MSLEPPISIHWNLMVEVGSTEGQGNCMTLKWIGIELPLKKGLVITFYVQSNTIFKERP